MITSEKTYTSDTLAPSPRGNSLISFKIKYSSHLANKKCKEQAVFMILDETTECRNDDVTLYMRLM